MFSFLFDQVLVMVESTAKVIFTHSNQKISSHIKEFKTHLKLRSSRIYFLIDIINFIYSLFECAQYFDT